MNSKDFLSWLSGVIDAVGDGIPTQTQWDMISTVLDSIDDVEYETDSRESTITCTDPTCKCGGGDYYKCKIPSNKKLLLDNKK